MERFWHKDPTKKERREFGLVVGGVLLLLAGYFAWRHPQRGWHEVLWPIGAALVLLGLVLPVVLKPFFQVWMAFAYVLGRIMTAVILTLTFVLVFAPMAFLLKLLGKDLLDRRWPAADASSFWKPHDRIDVPNRHLKPF